MQLREKKKKKSFIGPGIQGKHADECVLCLKETEG